MAKRIDYSLSGGVERVVEILDSRKYWCIVAYNQETVALIGKILDLLLQGPTPDEDDVVAIHNQRETLYPFRLFFYVRRTLVDPMAISVVYRDLAGKWVSPEELEGVEFMTDTSDPPEANGALVAFTSEVARIRARDAGA